MDLAQGFLLEITGFQTVEEGYLVKCILKRRVVEDLNCQPFILPNKDTENVNSGYHRHLTKTVILHTKVNRLIFMRKVTTLRFLVIPLCQG